MTKSDIVRKFITDNPKIKNKKEIARHVTAEHPSVFKDIEHARSIVRNVTGSKGNKIREAINKPELTKFYYNGFEKWATENLNAELRPWDEPFQIPSSIKELNCIADIHSVYLDHHVFKSFLKETKNKEALMINGDLLDSESLSRHLKGHNLIEYDRELDLAYDILKMLKAEFNHIYFKEGNHDFWLERYLLTNAREIFRLRGVGLKELLRLGELGIHHIHNLKYWRYGDLDGVHGHEFPGFGNGKFPSVGLLDKWQTFRGKYDVKIFCSHSHREDKTIGKKSKDGKFGQSWVGPAMCRKAAHYSPYAGWQNGWNVFRINNDGITEVYTRLV